MKLIQIFPYILLSRANIQATVVNLGPAVQSNSSFMNYVYPMSTQNILLTPKPLTIFVLNSEQVTDMSKNC